MSSILLLNTLLLTKRVLLDGQSYAATMSILTHRDLRAFEQCPCNTAFIGKYAPIIFRIHHFALLNSQLQTRNRKTANIPILTIENILHSGLIIPLWPFNGYWRSNAAGKLAYGHTT
jgi:hypothetical protein